MNNWRYKLFQFMQGRYGMDDFGKFLLIASMVILLLSNFRLFRILYILAMLLLVYTWFRIMSKNIFKRQQENQRYLTLRNKLSSKKSKTAYQESFKWRKRNNTQQNHENLQYNFYRCRNCGQTVRVPKGKGTIKITCPSCGNSFIDRT